MTRFRLLSYALTFAAGVALTVWWTHSPLPGPIAPETAKQLAEEGFQEAGPEAPKIPDAPKGTRGLAAAKGKLEFGPEHPQVTISSKEAGCFTAESGTADPLPCDLWTLTPADLAGDCEAEILTAEGHPFARLTWTGRARTPAGIVERGPEVVRDISFTWRSPELPLARAGEARIGLSTRGEAVAGASLYGAGHRVGVWGEASYPILPGRSPSVAAGLAVRF